MPLSVSHVYHLQRGTVKELSKFPSIRLVVAGKLCNYARRAASSRERTESETATRQSYSVQSRADGSKVLKANEKTSAWGSARKTIEKKGAQCARRSRQGAGGKRKAR